MPIDEGSQIVTIRFHRPVDSDVVNKRFKDIRMLGIHKGGYITSTPGNPVVSLSPLVCEISDGTHQVRVETTSAVTKTLSVVAPYLVLNWDYSGVVDTDFMEITTSGNPDANDIIVGKGNFPSGTFSTIDYSERTTPDTHHLFLHVEEMETPSSSVRVKAGVGHAGSSHSSIIDKVVDLSAYASGNTVYVYVNDSGGVVHSKTASDYVGKALLAKIVYPADGIIENSDIEDVRSFVTPPAIPDGSSVTRSSTGKLEVKDLGITTVKMANLGVTNDKIHSNVADDVTIEKDGSTGKLQVKNLGITSIFGPRTAKDTEGNTFRGRTAYQTQCDGFVTARGDASRTHSEIYGETPVGTKWLWDKNLWYDGVGSITMPVIRGDTWKVTYLYQSGYLDNNVVISWLPIGTGGCVKQ